MDRATYVGIDTSTQGIALSSLKRGDKAKYRWVSLSGSLLDKMVEAERKVRFLFEGARCDDTYVMVEEPIYINNGKTHKALCIIYASALLGIIATGIKPVPVNIGTWKKNTVGTGNANKQAIKDWVIETGLLEEGYRQDAYDATAIAYYLRGTMKICVHCSVCGRIVWVATPILIPVYCDECLRETQERG